MTMPTRNTSKAYFGALLLLFALCLPTTLVVAEHWDEHELEETKAEMGQALSDWKAKQANQNRDFKKERITIPTYFHVVEGFDDFTGKPGGDLTDVQLATLLEYSNSVFEENGAPFVFVAKGVERVFNDEWYNYCWRSKGMSCALQLVVQ
jgi:hypothetical protein